MGPVTSTHQDNAQSIISMGEPLLKGPVFRIEWHLVELAPTSTSHNTDQYRTPYTIHSSTGRLTQYRPVQDTLHNTLQYRTPYTIHSITGHLTQYRPVQDTSHSTGQYRTPVLDL